MTRKLRLGTLLAALAAAAALASIATAGNFGNSIVPRTYTDGFYAFTIVDTAATVPVDGLITHLNYYAANTGSFKFVQLNAADTVLWVSPDITPAQTGAATFTPAAALTAHAGDVFGVYSDSVGVIPFDLNGSGFANSTGPDSFNFPFQATPTVGVTLPLPGLMDRSYSYNADEIACLSFGIGQPINADGSSVFKAKRGVVPVKLTGCADPSISPQVSLVRTSSNNPGPIDEVSSVSAADSGTTMRWDPTAGQYIYNLSVADLGAGTYTLTVKVAGATVASVGFGLN